MKVLSKHRAGQSLIAAMALIVVVIGETSSAGASDHWNYVDRKWASSSVPFANGNVSYFGPNAGAALQLGTTFWNGRGGSSFDAWYAGGDASEYSSPCDKQGGMWIYQADLGPDILGAATWCISGSQPVYTIVGAATRMSTNSALSWYVDTGYSIAPSQYDFAAILAHEVGHMWGHVNHWADPSTECPGGFYQSTMCPYGQLGSVEMRSPEFHESQHLQQVYP